MAIIYMAINMINNKCYIGKTIQKLEYRKNRHISAADKGSKTYFHNAIRKYGKNSFEFDILEKVSKEELSETEMFWIAYYKSIGLPLYNMTNGGDGGCIFRDNETKIKISKSNVGKHHTNKTREKIGQSNSKEFFGLVAPDGIIYSPIINLTSFSRDMGLSVKCLHRVCMGKRKSHKGWKIYIS